MTFPAPNQSMVFIRLRLIFQRHTSGRSRQCLLPFWRTVVVTYSLLLVRLAAKGSQQLSHWYDIVTIDLKKADPGAIMVKFAIFSTNCAISCDTPERFFLLREKNAQWALKQSPNTIDHLLKFHTRVTQICEFPCESMTICLFPLNRVDPALTVSYPDYGSWSDHISQWTCRAR